VKQFLGAALGTTLYFVSSMVPMESGARAGLYVGGAALLAMSLTSILLLTIRTVRAKSRSAVYVVKSKMIMRHEVIRLDAPRDLVIVLDEPQIRGLLALANA
jgi:hypothetical protein